MSVEQVEVEVVVAWCIDYCSSVVGEAVGDMNIVDLDGRAGVTDTPEDLLVVVDIAVAGYSGVLAMEAAMDDASSPCRQKPPE